jgi:hypothetical protein
MDNSMLAWVSGIGGVVTIALAWTEEGGKAWEHWYSNGKGKYESDLLQRDRTHILRLSMIYAVLDRCDKIDVPHLQAALAIWDYSANTVERLDTLEGEGEILREWDTTNGNLAKGLRNKRTETNRKPRRYRPCPFPKSGARRPDQLA